jgi:hypothetical protein
MRQGCGGSTIWGFLPRSVGNLCSPRQILELEQVRGLLRVAVTPPSKAMGRIEEPSSLCCHPRNVRQSATLLDPCLFLCFEGAAHECSTQLWISPVSQTLLRRGFIYSLPLFLDSNALGCLSKRLGRISHANTTLESWDCVEGGAVGDTWALICEYVTKVAFKSLKERKDGSFRNLHSATNLLEDFVLRI